MLDLKAKTIFKLPPVIEGQVDKAICSEILSAVYDAQSKDPIGAVVSNAGGWQSQPQSQGAYPAMDQLANDLLMPAAEQIYERFELRTKPVFSNYWFNINYRHNYNESHIHPGAFFSGVLYLKVPKDSGGIKFYSPDPFVDCYTPASGVSTEMPSTAVMTPIAGSLIFFPGHYRHSVEQNVTQEHDDRRISVAFNFT